jgi:hypothetical protein
VKSVRASDLQIRLSGAASLDAAGDADKLNLQIDGAARAELKDLHTKTAKADVSGAGNATLNTSDALNAKVSGAGNINYVHAPKSLQKSISGAGNISPQ